MEIQRNVSFKNLLKLLLEHATDDDAEKYITASVLKMATENNDLSTVQYILKAYPKIDKEKIRSILHLAIVRDTVVDSVNIRDIVDALLEYGFSVYPEDAKNGMLMHSAVRRGHLEIVETLLKYGADVNWSSRSTLGRTHLHCAADYKQYEVAKVLIKHGADVNAKDSHYELPIYCTMRNWDVNMTKLLLSNGAYLKYKKNVLDYAIGTRCIDIVEMLLQHDSKLDINAPFEYGQNLLVHVIESDPTQWALDENLAFLINVSKNNFFKTEVVRLCLKRGARTDVKTNRGCPLHSAVARGLVSVVQLLLEHGAGVDSRGSISDKTPLLIAVEQDRLDIVKMLLERFPESEFRDRRGRTALRLASEGSSLDIVEELLNYGADINSKCDDDETPYSCAMSDSYSQTNKEVLMVLRRHILKIKALGLYVNSKDSRRVKLQEYFYTLCEREVNKIKGTKISGSNVTFHALLTKDLDKLAICMRNKNLVDALESEDHRKKFPVYFGMMYWRFKKAIKMESLLTPGAKSLDSLIGFKLPDLVSIELLSYLSILDLKNLIEASFNTD